MFKVCSLNLSLSVHTVQLPSYGGANHINSCRCCEPGAACALGPFFGFSQRASRGRLGPGVEPLCLQQKNELRTCEAQVGATYARKQQHRQGWGGGGGCVGVLISVRMLSTVGELFTVVRVLLRGLDNAVLGCPGSWLCLAACPGPANVSGEQKELQLFLKKAHLKAGYPQRKGHLFLQLSRAMTMLAAQLCVVLLQKR